jgi:hypothetical protein
MFVKILIFFGLASAGLLLLLLNVTTPATAGAFGIFGVFLLGYIVSTVVMTFAVAGTAMIVRRLVSEVRPSKPVLAKLELKKAYYYASVVALAPVIFVSLQSVGGVGVYEVLLVVLLVALGCLYISKRSG